MSLKKRFLRLFRGPEKIVYNELNAAEELERIKEMMKPSSMVPINEVLYALYNFQTALKLEFNHDLSTLKGLEVRMHSRTSTRLSLMLRDSMHAPCNKVAIFNEVFHSSHTTKPALDWYSNEESIPDCLDGLLLWSQIGMRAHYDHSSEGPFGEYDEPINKAQREFVFSSVYVKVIADWLELLTLIVYNQPEGKSLEETQYPGKRQG